MFCFQCEQTTACKECTSVATVCIPKSNTIVLQEKLTGALIGLARSTAGNESLITNHTNKLFLEGLFATSTTSTFDEQTLEQLIEAVLEEKKRLVPNCFYCMSSCGRNDDYNMEQLCNDPEDIRSLKSLILLGIRNIATYSYHAAIHGYENHDLYPFFYRALFAIGMDWDIEELLPIVLEVGKINLNV